MFSKLIQLARRTASRLREGNPLFRRLRGRITLLAVMLLVVLYSISSFAVYFIVESTVMRGIDRELFGSLHHVVVDPDHNPGIFGVYALIETAPGNIQLTGARPTSSKIVSPLAKAIQRTHAQSGFINFKLSGSRFRARYQILGPSIPMNGTSRTSRQTSFKPFVATFIDDTQYLRVLSGLKRVILIVGAFGLLAAALVGFFLAERMLRPIRSAWQRQIEFVADASHELRTPLAVIQSNLGIVMEHTNDSVLENLEWLNNAHGESRRLAKLVQDLLTLARSDSERMPVERTRVDLQDLLSYIQELYETIAEMKDISLELDAQDPVIILGDRDRLHQLFVILLDNSVKFTQTGGTIQISLTEHRNSAFVTISDTGLGIAKENLQRVFDRFFTVDPSRTRDQPSKGTGLGLSIARWITDAHGGRITIDSEGIGLGTTVRIELPAGDRLQITSAPFLRKG